MIEIFIKRLQKIGINISFFSNYPWIYIDKINNIPVQEKFMSEHGFVVAFLSIKNQDIIFTDIKEIFKIIRKYGTI